MSRLEREVIVSMKEAEVTIRSRDALLLTDIKDCVKRFMEERKLLLEKDSHGIKGGYGTYTATLIRLEFDGFFDKGRTLQEIRNKLYECNMPIISTTLRPILMRLVERKRFGLIRTDGAIEYISKGLYKNELKNRKIS